MFEIVKLYNDNVNYDYLEEVLNVALKREALKDVFFTVILVDNDYIHNLNLKYRNIDKETDVISFALEDNKDIKTSPRMLGDIYISIPKAKEQAKLYEHSVKREVCFLAIHGFYHLLGYDHQTKEEESIMFKRQEDVLNEYGIEK